MSTQTTTTLYRQWTMMLTMDDDANSKAATQMTGDDADKDNAAADVNAGMKTIR
jgi:hypothetical protein